MRCRTTVLLRTTFLARPDIQRIRLHNKEAALADDGKLSSLSKRKTDASIDILNNFLSPGTPFSGYISTITQSKMCLSKVSFLHPSLILTGTELSKSLSVLSVVASSVTATPLQAREEDRVVRGPLAHGSSAVDDGSGCGNDQYIFTAAMAPRRMIGQARTCGSRTRTCKLAHLLRTHGTPPPSGRRPRRPP